MASQRTLLTSNNNNNSGGGGGGSGNGGWNDGDNSNYSGSFRRCCPPIYDPGSYDSNNSNNWQFFHSYPTTYSSFKKTAGVNRPRYNPMAMVSKPLQQPLHPYSNYLAPTDINYPSPSLSSSSSSSSPSPSSYYHYNSTYSPNCMYVNSPASVAYRYDPNQLQLQQQQQQQQQRYHPNSAINEQQVFQQQQQQQQPQQRHLYFHQNGRGGGSGGAGGGGAIGSQLNPLYCTQSCCQPSASTSSSLYSRPVSKKYLAETNSKLNLREFLETWNENSDESIVTATVLTPEQSPNTEETDAAVAASATGTNCYDLDRIFSDDAFWLSSFADDIEVARMIDELNYECRSKMTDNGCSTNETNGYDDVTKLDDTEWPKYDTGGGLGTIDGASDETTSSFTTTLLPIT